MPGNRGGSTSMNFYTDDQPGLKMSPVGPISHHQCVVNSTNILTFCASYVFCGSEDRGGEGAIVLRPMTGSMLECLSCHC